jgi:tryptophanyl-tRNA synthetase
MVKENNKTNELIVDALDGIGLIDYERLVKEFGIEPMSEFYPNLPEELHDNFMTRGIMFGHTDIGKVFEAIKQKKPFAIMTGIKTTGKYHVGSLSTCHEVIYFQKLGGFVYFCLADLEAFATNQIPLTEQTEIAIDNIADILALGLDPERAYIYRQSTEPIVQRVGLLASSTVTMNKLRSTYGEKSHLGYYNSALVQVADILLPQIKGGPMPTVTPIGADQAPHSRLTREIARKPAFADYNFVDPSFTFHIMMQGIDGSDKMAKRNPMSVFTFDESMKDIKKKINNALTGGRDTAAEQREKGADPTNCRVYDLLSFMFEESDEALLERNRACRSGEILCGHCKKYLLENIETFRADHLEKKKNMRELAEKIVKGISKPLH